MKDLAENTLVLNYATIRDPPRFRITSGRVAITSLLLTVPWGCGVFLIDWLFIDPGPQGPSNLHKNIFSALSSFPPLIALGFGVYSVKASGFGRRNISGSIVISVFVAYSLAIGVASLQDLVHHLTR